jgi:hypothetical protein
MKFRRAYVIISIKTLFYKLRQLFTISVTIVFAGWTINLIFVIFK